MSQMIDPSPTSRSLLDMVERASLFALFIGILYLSQSRQFFIEARIRSLQVQAEIIAGAIAAFRAKQQPHIVQVFELGTDAGVRTVALLTEMSTPLGLTAGNALEVRESVEVLAGGGPADVVELTIALAREMLQAAGRTDVDPADALADGRAMDVWRRMIQAQGGDPDAPLPVAKLPASDAPRP